MKALVLFLVISNLVFAAEEKAPSLWAHESEAGISLSGGNSDSKTYLAKQTTSYKPAGNTFNLQGAVFFSEANGVEVSKNWNLSLRYDRQLFTKHWGFIQLGTESDPFAGYDNRTNVDLGMKMDLIVGEVNYAFAEVGYRYSNEFRVAGASPRTVESHIARVYAEAQKSLNENVTAKLWIEEIGRAHV